MQMIERPWGVAVFGAASVQARPELVRIRFEVSRVEQTPAGAFAAANEAVHAVRLALREHDVPDSAVQSSRLDLKSTWRHVGDERRFAGYRCEAAFLVESTALDDIQQLLIDVVSAGANEIDAVEFDVSGKPEKRAEARQQAVREAQRKAELYAEAAGIRLGPIVHIDDVDPESIGRFRGHGGGGRASDGDLSPGHVVVSAAVTLGFSIQHA